MKARELAEKIYELSITEPKSSVLPKIVSLLEAALGEAVEEAKLVGFIHGGIDVGLRVKDHIVGNTNMVEESKAAVLSERLDWERENISKMKAAAYEDAAKIAEKGPPVGSVVPCEGDLRNPYVVASGFQKWIAEKIRQKASELK